MIVGRFKVRARPEYAAEVAAAITAVEALSRLLPGVVHVDVARSLTEPDVVGVPMVVVIRSGARTPRWFLKRSQRPTPVR